MEHTIIYVLQINNVYTNICIFPELTLHLTLILITEDGVMHIFNDNKIPQMVDLRVIYGGGSSAFLKENSNR